MSGVRVGSRLQRLQDLHRRIGHELASAQRRQDGRELNRLSDLEAKVEAEIVAEGGRLVPRVAVLRTRRKKSDVRKDKRMADLGITAKDVKIWAVSEGLLMAVKQGRVKAELIEAYADAHQGTSERIETTPTISEEQSA